jgi:hypothetical protein
LAAEIHLFDIFCWDDCTAERISTLIPTHGEVPDHKTTSHTSVFVCSTAFGPFFLGSRPHAERRRNIGVILAN